MVRVRAMKSVALASAAAMALLGINAVPAHATLTTVVEGKYCHTQMDSYAFDRVDALGTLYAKRLSRIISEEVIPHLVAAGALTEQQGKDIVEKNNLVQTPFTGESMSGNLAQWEYSAVYWLKQAKQRAKDSYDTDGLFIKEFSDEYPDLSRLAAVNFIVKTFFIPSATAIEPDVILHALPDSYIAALRTYHDYQWHISRYSVLRCIEALGGNTSIVEADPMPNSVNPNDAAPVINSNPSDPRTVMATSSLVHVRFLGST